jgi:DNA-directed RNA polymerase subunit alpha
MDILTTSSSSLTLELYDDEDLRGIDPEPLSKFRLGKFTDLDHAATIANLIRRNLLSRIPTTGVVGVKIPNISQEFSSIPGVREDVIELMLNLRRLIFTGYLRKSTIAHITFKGPGIITSADIYGLESSVDMDSHQYIATIEESITFELTLVVTTCIGFFNEELPPEFLPVATVFAPVTSAVYYFESCKEEVEVDVVKLETPPTWDVIFELRTNGSISPLYALITSFRVVQEMFKNLPTRLSDVVQLASRTEDLRPPSSFNGIQGLDSQASSMVATPDSTELNSLPIDTLDLPPRIRNTLAKENILVISDLLKYSRRDLLQLKNIGKTSVQKVSERLYEVCSLELL